ncbi:MAG: Ulp1 family isopeptidase [Wolbachia endosymbiont of Xenopsylla cheopis]
MNINIYSNDYKKKHLSNGFKVGVTIGVIISLAVCIAVGLPLFIASFSVINLIFFFGLAITLTLISAVASGIIGSIVSLLFHSSKDLIRHGKKFQGRATKLEKTDSGIRMSLDILSIDESASNGRDSTSTSPDTKSDSAISLDNEKFDEIEAYNTLVYQTMKKYNYKYWLQQYDIAYIAKVKYGWTESSLIERIFFCIPGNVNSLNERLKEYKKMAENQKAIFASIINLGGNHWVTLVVTTGPDDKFSAYYCDSLSTQLPRCAIGKITDDIQLANEITEACIKPLSKESGDLIKQKESNPNNQVIDNQKEDITKTLVECRKRKNKLVNKEINTNYIMGTLQETLKIDKNNVRSFKSQQQNDGYNCGIFALKNAKIITQMFSEDKSLDDVDEALLEYKPDLKQLENTRKEFAKALGNDKEWKDAVSSGMFIEDVVLVIAYPTII